MGAAWIATWVQWHGQVAWELQFKFQSQEMLRPVNTEQFATVSFELIQKSHTRVVSLQIEGRAQILEAMFTKRNKGCWKTHPNPAHLFYSFFAIFKYKRFTCSPFQLHLHVLCKGAPSSVLNEWSAVRHNHAHASILTAAALRCRLAVLLNGCSCKIVRTVLTAFNYMRMSLFARTWIYRKSLTFIIVLNVNTEEMAKYRYLEKTATKHNRMHDKIKSNLNSELPAAIPIEDFRRTL